MPEVEVNELLLMDLEDLAIERSMLDILKDARSLREIFIVNGLERGNITRAFNGEHVGTAFTWLRTTTRLFTTDSYTVPR